MIGDLVVAVALVELRYSAAPTPPPTTTTAIMPTSHGVLDDVRRREIKLVSGASSIALGAAALGATATFAAGGCAIGAGVYAARAAPGAYGDGVAMAATAAPADGLLGA